MANSSTTYAVRGGNSKTEIHTWTWLSDDSDGSITALASDTEIHGFITRFVTNPGSAAPTDNYDVTLADADACDVLGGAGSNRDTSTSEQGIPLVGGAYGPCRVSSALTFSGSAAGNAKTGTFTIYVERD